MKNNKCYQSIDYQTNNNTQIWYTHYRGYIIKNWVDKDTNRIVQEKIPASVRNDFNTYQWARTQWHNPPTTAEQYYYRHLYNQHYVDASNTIPYMWMPKFVAASDASARTLQVYHNIVK